MNMIEDIFMSGVWFKFHSIKFGFEIKINFVSIRPFKT